MDDTKAARCKRAKLDSLHDEFFFCWCYAMCRLMKFANIDSISLAPESDWVVHLQVCRRFSASLHYFSFESHRRLLSAFACDFVTSISELLHESRAASWSTPQVISSWPTKTSIVHTTNKTKKEKRDESREIVIRQHHQHHITLHPLSRRNKYVKKSSLDSLSAQQRARVCL